MIITILRKPLEGSVADNTLKYGCGSINIDDTRIPHNEEIKVIKAQKTGNLVYSQSGRYDDTTELKPNGRWPANIILVGDDPTQELDRQSGYLKRGRVGVVLKDTPARSWKNSSKQGIQRIDHGDSGGASRYFKQFKKDEDQ